MSFDWADYLRVARELVGTAAPTHDEARLRAAISRAYYAAFNKCRFYLENVDYVKWSPDDRRRGGHEFVITQFAEHPDETRQLIGDRLDRLRVQRVRADYRLIYIDLHIEAPKAISTAQRILELLKP